MIATSQFLVFAFTLFFVSCILISVLKFVVIKNGWTAKVTSDRWHKKETGLHGGVAIAMSVFLGVVALFLFSPLSQSFTGNSQYTWFITSFLSMVLGLVDDIYKLSARTKFFGQVLLASLFVIFTKTLPLTPYEFFNKSFFIFWIVGISNAINLIDNMDGLSTGITIIISFGLGLLFNHVSPNWSLFFAIYVIVLFSFLLFNFRPASIFMGDSGTLFLGHSLASIVCMAPAQINSIALNVHLDYFIFFLKVILIFSIPIFDTTFVTITRKLTGRKISQGGRDHLSHRLTYLKFNEIQSVLLLYSLGLLCMLTANFLNQEISFISTIGIFILSFLLLGYWINNETKSFIIKKVHS